MQGLSLPLPSVVSCCPLPPLQTRPTEVPPPPQQPHIYDEPPDTVGQARVRGAFTTTATITTTTTVATAQPSTSLPTFSVPPPSPGTPASTVYTASTPLATPLSSPSTEPSLGSTVTVITTSLATPLSSLGSTVTAASRTTDWRRRKREAELNASSGIKKPRVERKGYTCRICGELMNKCRFLYVMCMLTTNVSLFTATGHTQFKGQRYCPKICDLSQEEWLSQRREAAASKVSES